MRKKLQFIKVQHPWQYDPYSDPPLGLLSVAAVARRDGEVEVSLTDLAHETEVPASDFFALSASTLEFPAVELKARDLKTLYPTSKIIVGGPHFDVLPEEYWRKQILDLPFDVICRGEGEKTVLEALKTSEKEVVSSKGELLDLDTLPLPARDILEKERYFNSGKTFSGGSGAHYSNGNSSTIMVSRGCPNSCSFCASPSLHFRKVRFRSLENVKLEVSQLMENYHVGSLRWQDDNIPLNLVRQKGLEDFLHETEVISRGSARTDHIARDPSILDRLWFGGFREIGYGLESAEDDVLYLLDKKTTVENHRKAIIETKRRGFRTRAFIMSGLPGEKENSSDRMIDLLEEVKPDVVTLTSFMPFPGSDIFRNPSKYGVSIETFDWKKYNLAISPDNPDPFIHSLTTVSRDGMIRNLENLKSYLFNRGLSNVPAYNKPYISKK